MPRARIGSPAASAPGTPFRDADKLGAHSYGYLGAFFEKNGIVYSAAGSIEVAHLRWHADYTRHLVKRTRKTLMKKGKGRS